MSDTITIKEEVDVGRAKQLLSLPNDKFESIVWSDEQCMKGEKELTKEGYIEHEVRFIEMPLLAPIRETIWVAKYKACRARIPRW